MWHPSRLDDASADASSKSAALALSDRSSHPRSIHIHWPLGRVCKFRKLCNSREDFLIARDHLVDALIRSSPREWILACPSPSSARMLFDKPPSPWHEPVKLPGKSDFPFQSSRFEPEGKTCRGSHLQAAVRGDLATDCRGGA